MTRIYALISLRNLVEEEVNKRGKDGSFSGKCVPLHHFNLAQKWWVEIKF